MFGIGLLELIFGILLVVVAAPAALLVWRSSRKGRPIGPDRILALCYGIHGVAIGGLSFVSAIIGSQGARSHAEVNAGLVAVLLQPVPMFITALALWLGWRWGRLLAVLLPFVLAACYLERLFGAPGPPGNMDPDAMFPFYFCAVQLENIPGATMLGLVTARFMLRDAKIARRPAPQI
jgi:hypothetical protein